MATLRVWDGGVWFPTLGRVWDGSAWVGTKKFWDGTQWVVLDAGVPGPIIVIISPAATDVSNDTCPFASPPITAIVSGGEGPFTYSWTWFVGGINMIINNPLDPTVTITKSIEDVSTGTLRCTVTDSLSSTATGDSSITMECGVQ